MYITPNEQLKGDLITILSEEYGSGNPRIMHALLFLKTIKSIGITKEEVDTTPKIPEVQSFEDTIEQVWSNKEQPARAYGIAYLFETIGANIHRAIHSGLLKSQVPKESLEYSQLHCIAEEHHAKRVTNGLGVYESEQSELLEGVEQGALALEKLWTGLQKHVFRR